MEILIWFSLFLNAALIGIIWLLVKDAEKTQEYINDLLDGYHKRFDDDA